MSRVREAIAVAHTFSDIVDYLYHVGGSDRVECGTETEALKFIRRVRREVGSDYPITITQHKTTVNLVLRQK
jgi:hypothetical protein